jgi:hypothetical protein
VPRLEALEARTVPSTLTFTAGPLIQVSKDPDPLAGQDNGLPQDGNQTFDDEAEPKVVADPTNPEHLVATWPGHRGQSTFAGVTFDGGTSWRTVAIPGISTINGGIYQGVFDPYIRSMAPNGDVYQVSGAFGLRGGPGAAGILASKSTDGGLTWSTPVSVIADTSVTVFDDKPSLTADPADPSLAYIVWERDVSGRGAATFVGTTLFSRTTDGGRTWEPARVIADPGPHNRNSGHQILVQPDGTLVCLFTQVQYDNHTKGYTYSLGILRSADKGLTWSGPTQGPSLQFVSVPSPNGGFTTVSVVDPETGLAVFEWSTTTSVAVDRHTGNLYAVWEDARFNNGQYDQIAFSQSTDGGLTWSRPIPVNQTPSNIPVADRQAFIPTVAAADDGTIGVTYYDFRNNDASPSTLTDYWFVNCRPTKNKPATDPANWGNEVRLSDSSFDLQKAAFFEGGEFVGDSNGLAAAGNDLVAVWSMPTATDQGNIYFRRLTARQDGAADFATGLGAGGVGRAVASGLDNSTPVLLRAAGGFGPMATAASSPLFPPAQGRTSMAPGLGTAGRAGTGTVLLLGTTFDPVAWWHSPSDSRPCPATPGAALRPPPVALFLVNRIAREGAHASPAVLDGRDTAAVHHQAIDHCFVNLGDDPLADGIADSRPIPPTD